MNTKLIVKKKLTIVACLAGIMLLLIGPIELKSQNKHTNNDSTGQSREGIAPQDTLVKIMKDKSLEDRKPRKHSDFETMWKNLPSKPRYATNWIDISGRRTVEQKEIIADTVAAYLKGLEEKMFKNQLPQKHTTLLSTKWQLDKKELIREWVDEYLSKEKEYDTSFQMLTKSVQDSQRIHNAIKAKRLEKETINDSIRTLISDRIQYEISQAHNGERLKKRLSYLSMGVVMIARIPNPSGQLPGPQKVAMTNAMIKEAVRKINGERIRSFTQVYGDKITRLIALENQGNAQVTDTYFQSLILPVTTPDQGKQFYLYQIHNVEVYPFDTKPPKFYSTQKTTSKTGAIDDVIEIYLIENENTVQLRSNNSTKRMSLAELELPESAINYIRTQYDFSQQAVRRIKEEINKYEMHHDEIDREYKFKIIETDKTLKPLKKRKEAIERNITNSLAKLVAIRAKITDYKRIKKQKKKAYEDFYKNRKDFVNKIEQQYVRGDMPRDQLVREMAKRTFSIIKDIKKEKVEEQVLLEQTETGERVSRLENISIELSARVESFRILYLTLDLESTPVPVFLNIAYNVNWSSENYIEIDTLQNILTDIANGFEWKLANLRPCSPRRPCPPEDGTGWRFATSHELQNLAILVARYQDDEDVHVFGKLKWPLKYPYLADPFHESTIEIDEQNQEFYKCYDFKNYRGAKIEEYSRAYVLWVRKKQALTRK